MEKGYYAHTPTDPNARTPPEGWQKLAEHLTAVAQLALHFAQEARPILAGDTEAVRQEKEAFHQGAYWAGLLHDLGKYRPEFQNKLWKVPGRSQEETWHKQAGAAAASQRKRYDLAFAIAGHHGGIPDLTGPNGLRNLVKSPGGEDVADEVRSQSL